MEEDLRAEAESIKGKLTDPSIFSTRAGQDLLKRQAELASLLGLYDKRANLQKQLSETEALLQDPQLGELASSEIKGIKAELAAAETALEEALMPKDPRDDRNALVEIRAGAGGDESSLFAGELYRMYARFGEKKGWRVELLSESPSDVGGYKEIIFKLTGQQAFGTMKYESGVHRVQRVPVTESSGRIHTSTATVAVLPEAEETDIEINPSDLRIDVFRSSGPGGQSVNTTDSAVRITHLPSGTVVTCQDEKSQHKNKAKALSVLRSRLLAVKLEAEQSKAATERRSQIGSGDRSEKVRTYNIPQDRITDHRIGLTRHSVVDFLAGNIDEMVDALREADRAALKAQNS